MCWLAFRDTFHKGTEKEERKPPRRSLIRRRTNVFSIFIKAARLWIFGLEADFAYDSARWCWYGSVATMLGWVRLVVCVERGPRLGVKYISILRTKWNETVPSFDFVVCRRSLLNKSIQNVWRWCCCLSCWQWCVNQQQDLHGLRICGNFRSTVQYFVVVIFRTISMDKEMQRNEKCEKNQFSS